MLRPLENPKELSRESKKDKKTESLRLKLVIFSPNNVFTPASALALDNQEEPMVTFLKEKNSNSTPRRSNLEENDCKSTHLSHFA